MKYYRMNTQCPLSPPIRESRTDKLIIFKYLDKRLNCKAQNDRDKVLLNKISIDELFYSPCGQGRLKDLLLLYYSVDLNN